MYEHNRSARSVRSSYAIAAFVCLILAVGLFLWLRDGPVLLPPQGRQNLLTAISLADGRGFEFRPGIPFAKFAPLYPVLLAGARCAGLAPIPSIYLINCLSFAGCLFGLYCLARAMAGQVAWVAVLFFGVLAPNYYLLRTARADAIATCMSLFAMVAMIDYARSRSRSGLVTAAVACSVAATARYMMLFALLPPMAMATWVFTEPGVKRRLRSLLFFSVISGGPIALWMLRNRFVTGYLSGMSRTRPRAPAQNLAFGDHATGFAKTIYLDLFGVDALGVKDVVYGRILTSYPLVTMGTALCAGVLFSLMIWSRRCDLLSFVARNVQGRTRSGCGMALVSGYAAWYITTLLGLWTFGNNDPIHTRYVTPLYGCAIVLVFTIFPVVSCGANSRATALALLAVALSIGIPNVAKSIRLLGDHPSQRLLEIPVLVNGNRWRSDITWGSVWEATRE